MIKTVHYRGTNNFIAALLYDDTIKANYFGFALTENPEVVLEGDKYKYHHLDIIFEEKMSFNIKVRPIGKDKKNYILIKIDPSEFDSMYKLLESIYE